MIIGRDPRLKTRLLSLFKKKKKRKEGKKTRKSAFADSIEACEALSALTNFFLPLFRFAAVANEKRR